MRKILVILLVALALLGAACGNDDNGGGNAKKKAAGPSGAQTYDVDMDADASPQYQVAAYYPGQLTVRPGDTIVFNNKSKVHPHTVTFGIKADQSNRPAAITAKGEENPVAFAPCFTDTEASPQLAACPSKADPANPPAYAGRGFWSSGILSAAAGPAAPAKITLKLADSIAPGNYSYVCMLHPFQAGSIKVAATDGDRLTPAAVRTSAEASAKKAVADTSSLKAPAATAGTVTAGWGDRITAVMAYDPAALNVKVGDTVTWKDASPYEPHTVTFESMFKTPGDPGATAPAGVKSGGTYTNGFTSSGLFGPQPFFESNTFSLTFAKAGTYNYVCTIHPGQKGTVTVA
ncbi:MAG: hypothetical protein H0W70_09535 [Actinobacteria bacterium]|nr:hypothetical protein [Actinomycetota bacterium]